MIRTFGYWGSSKRERYLKLHRNKGLELVLIERGEIAWKVEDRIEIVRPGEVFFTLPWWQHGGIGQDHSAYEMHFAVIPAKAKRGSKNPVLKFLPELHFTERQEIHYTKVLESLPRNHFPASLFLRESIKSLVQTLYENPRSAYRINNLIRVTLDELVRQAESEEISQPVDDSPKRIHNFIEKLPKHCHEIWDLDRMSAACGLARSQFAQHTQKYYGSSPMRLLNRIRIQKAKELLQDTDESITQIALGCGFSSSQYFATVFRQYTGKSPRAFRSRSFLLRTAEGQG